MQSKSASRLLAWHTLGAARCWPGVEATVAAGLLSELASLFGDEPLPPNTAAAESGAAEIDVYLGVLLTESEGVGLIVSAGDTEVVAVIEGLAPLLGAEVETSTVTVARSVLSTGFWTEDTLAELRLARDADPL